MRYGWETLSSGVYRCRLPFLDVTVGLVTGPRGVLLIDCGTTLTEAGRIAEDVRELAGAEVTHLVMTHHHFDHILTMDADNLRQVRSLARGLNHRARIEPLTTYSRGKGPKDVPDPYYGGADGFEQVLNLLEDACAGLLESLQAD
jgi:glyoxylase-like metal-dependent hydrolase (beta-lactamase superfamily II)